MHATPWSWMPIALLAGAALLACDSNPTAARDARPGDGRGDRDGGAVHDAPAAADAAYDGEAPSDAARADRAAASDGAPSDAARADAGAGTRAFAADDWLEFVSVQTHANWATELWTPAGWRARLGELKVRYSRGGWANPQGRAHLAALHASYGIRGSHTFTPLNADGTFDLAESDQMLADLKNLTGLEKLFSVEGPNEYTNGNKLERAFHAAPASDVLTTTAQGFVSETPTTFPTASHGYAAGEKVQLRTEGALPPPLQKDKLYFVRDATSTSFKLAATAGGAAIDVTGGGSGTHYVSNWAPRMRDYQAYLYGKIKSDPAYTAAGITVTSGSLWKRLVRDYEALGDHASTFDQVNLHLYQGARRPSRYGGDSGDDPLIEALHDAQLMGKKPVWITETGFNIDNAGQPTNNSTTTEEIASKYTLRMLCELMVLKQRQGGIAGFVNWYSLLDDPHTGNEFGLVRFSAGPTYTPRLHYYSLRNFLSLMNEGSWNGSAWSRPSFAPGALAFALDSGGNPDVRSLVAQKSDGRYYVIVWYDALSWRRLPVPGEELTTFSASAASDALTVAAAYYQATATGRPCSVSSSGALPGGLTAGTTYYVIKGAGSAIKLARTEADAQAGQAIDLTSAGSGKHRLTQRTKVVLTVSAPSFSRLNVLEPTVLSGESPDAKRDKPLHTTTAAHAPLALAVPDHVMVVELVP